MDLESVPGFEGAWLDPPKSDPDFSDQTKTLAPICRKWGLACSPKNKKELQVDRHEQKMRPMSSGALANMIWSES